VARVHFCAASFIPQSVRPQPLLWKLRSVTHSRSPIMRASALLPTPPDASPPESRSSEPCRTICTPSLYAAFTISFSPPSVPPSSHYRDHSSLFISSRYFSLHLHPLCLSACHPAYLQNHLFPTFAPSIPLSSLISCFLSAFNPYLYVPLLSLTSPDYLHFSPLPALPSVTTPHQFLFFFFSLSSVGTSVHAPKVPCDLSPQSPVSISFRKGGSYACCVC